MKFNLFHIMIIRKILNARKYGCSKNNSLIRLIITTKNKQPTDSQSIRQTSFLKLLLILLRNEKP